MIGIQLVKLDLVGVWNMDARAKNLLYTGFCTHFYMILCEDNILRIMLYKKVQRCIHLDTNKKTRDKQFL